MNTVVVWLLISVGSTGVREGRPSALIDRFATRDACIHVMTYLNASIKGSSHIHTCVDARVALIPSR